MISFFKILLDFISPCFIWHFWILLGLESGSLDGEQWKVSFLLPSSKKSLAASAHLQTASAQRNFYVEPEVDGMASVLKNCCAKEGSLGWICRFSLE